MGFFDWFRPSSHKEIDDLKSRVMEKREAEISDLQTLNKTVKIITEHGEIEVVIRNLRGVIRELVS